MNSSTNCRQPEDLQRFLLGQLTAGDADRVQEHLAACPRCLDTVSHLQASDTLLEAFRAQAHAPSPAEDDVVAGLIDKLGGVYRTGDTSAGDATSPGVERRQGTSEYVAVLAPAQAADEIGQLGGYRVLKVLGAGGMGIVFEAEDPQLHRRIALKVMKPELAARPADRQRFLREAQAMAAIEHDHIVAIYEVSKDRGVPYLAMQLLKGETLEDALRRAEGALPLPLGEGRGEGATTSASLPTAEALRITREIALGLAAAHAAGLTHRDIKPANIWLEKTGRVKLLDFGLARPAQDDAHLTHTGSIAGTPQYMAPEQAAGRPTDHLSDLFSLGCVLYRLLTGRLPFRGPSAMAVLRSLALDEPQPPHEINPEVPQVLSNLTMRLLCKEPRHRPQTAEAVSQELAEIGRSHLPDGTYRVASGPARQAGPTWSRRNLIVAATLLLLLAGPPAAWYAPAIYRIATNQGLLVIETDDDAVEVTVKQNGKLVKLVDRKTGREVTLKAGVYQLELSGDNQKQGFTLESNQFTLIRGGREIARVRQERPATPVPVPPAATPQESPARPFVVLPSGDRAEQTFATLAEAVAAATSGDTIEVRANGPFVLQPIDLADKALTLRAGNGAWPVLSLAPEAVQADLPLLTTRAALTLEGLEFQRDGDGKPDAFGLKHIHSVVAPLRLANCRFVRRSQTKALVAAVIAERSPLVQARNCIFVGDWYAGLSLHTADVQDSRLAVANCLFRTRNCGVQFAFFPDVPTASVQLVDSTFIAAAPVAISFPLLQIPTQVPGSPKVRIEARRNICPTGFMHVLFRPSTEETEGYLDREHRSLLRQSFTLDEQGNRFGEGVPLVAPTILSLAGKHRPQEPIVTRDQWNEFWRLDKPDSTFGPLRFAAQDLTGDVVAPDKLTPQDFRVLAGSGTNKGLAANVDLVGPGPAFERWKQTPEYQQWLQETGQVKAEAAPADKVFAILAADAREERKFATLAEAVAAATSGDTIEVRGNGPMIREPIDVTGKALTIRAAPGSRPVVEFSAASLGEGFAEYVRLQTDAPLVLEGLEIRRVGVTGEKVKRAEWAVVCRKAPVRMANCRFVVNTQPGTTALWADRSALCEVRNCEFVLGQGCTSVGWTCPSTGRLIWDNCVTAGGIGPGIDIGQRPQDISVQLTHSTCVGPALYVILTVPPHAALGEGNQPAPPCRLEVTENVFHSGYVLGFFQDFPLDAPETKAPTAADAEELLPRLVAWHGQRNLYLEHLNFLALGAAGETLNSVPRKTLEDWRQLWGPTETDSRQGRILFQGGEVATNVYTAPGRFTPGDVRLHADSAGKGASEGGRDLGADVDLVGPGAAYERWKNTPAYQEWLKAADQTP